MKFRPLPEAFSDVSFFDCAMVCISMLEGAEALSSFRATPPVQPELARSGFGPCILSFILRRGNRREGLSWICVTESLFHFVAKYFKNVVVLSRSPFEFDDVANSYSVSKKATLTNTLKFKLTK